MSLFEIKPTDGNVINEIFYNDFDTTWHHRIKADEHGGRSWTLVPGEHSIDDGSVTYKYNNEYFRCDDFKKEHDGLHILFAGCSETEGMGGQLEDSWGKILLQRISKSNKVDGYFSLAKAGYGWQKIITQTRVYIDKYGKPDILFVLLPNIGRLIRWSNAKNDWMYEQSYPNFELSNMNTLIDNLGEGKDSAPNSMSPEQYRTTFIDFVISWRLFEDFCKASGIDLVWGTWEQIDNYNINNLKDHDLFKYFIPISIDKFEQQLRTRDLNDKLKEFDLEKRDGHHGRLFHEFWADEFINESINRKIIK